MVCAPHGFVELSIMIIPLRALLLGGVLAVTPALDAHALDKSTVQDIVVQCEACHGLEGKSTEKGFPNLAGKSETYILQQLQSFRSGKRPHEEMRSMGRSLTAEEMKAVAQYFSKLPH
jgi:cytochrome c553